MNYSTRLKLELDQYSNVVGSEWKLGRANATHWVEPPRVECQRTLRLCQLRRNALMAWYGVVAEDSTYNPDLDWISHAIDRHSNACAAYTTSYLARDPTDIALGRYLAWNRVLTAYDGRVAWLEARDRGLLRRLADEQSMAFQYYVVGLKWNVRSILGRDEPLASSKQAEASNDGLLAALVERECPFGDDFAATVPLLEHEIWSYKQVGKREGMLSRVGLGDVQLRRVTALLTDSRHASDPDAGRSQGPSAWECSAVDAITAAIFPDSRRASGLPSEVSDASPFRDVNLWFVAREGERAPEHPLVAALLEGGACASRSFSSCVTHVVGDFEPIHQGGNNSAALWPARFSAYARARRDAADNVHFLSIPQMRDWMEERLVEVADQTALRRRCGLTTLPAARAFCGF